ncbi:hypothetical protein Tco_0208802, partial [Tanacetum coccineum]
MQEELHQFDRLQVWELVDKSFSKNVIKLKWLWKNKKDEDQTVIRNKAQLLAKDYWNGRIASMGIDAANGTPWTEVRKWMTEEDPEEDPEEEPEEDVDIELE